MNFFEGISRWFQEWFAPEYRVVIVRLAQEWSLTDVRWQGINLWAPELEKVWPAGTNGYFSEGQYAQMHFERRERNDWVDCRDPRKTCEDIQEVALAVFWQNLNSLR